MTRCEFYKLIDALLEGRLPEAAVQRLEQELWDNPLRQQQYREYCQLHINLHTDIRAQCVIDAVATSLGDQRPLAANQSVERKILRTDSQSLHTLLKLCGGLAVSVLLIGAVAVWSGTDRYFGSDANNSPGLQAAASGDVISVRLTSSECKTLPIGDVGTAMIQGPAYFELLGSRRAKLHQGRIKVRINEERGFGFVVETPGGYVTDLGNEFGVDVDSDSKTGVVVFSGEVDVTRPSQLAGRGFEIQRLMQGDAMMLGSPDEFDRIMSVVTGDNGTFRRSDEPPHSQSVISAVSDNIRSEGFKKFYEIVPGGLEEDALAYADRPTHDWNGLDGSGIPGYLVGADYVKPFNSDKMRGDVELSVTIATPARLYVFFDVRMEPPAWLTQGFRDTGDCIGLDMGPYVIDGVPYRGFKRGTGAGVSVDNAFSVWEMLVETPGVVRLGPNGGDSELTAMYGIAAVALQPHAASEL